ncbi:hypothetical protein BXZ70DRAFT_1011480 [Cristinia sonorae]|uniref:Peptidase C14 caspase domain-containing protein n=1 Tax=Cristinia sonorae TaxID=1940300 RepID=A0A8K0UGH9_9AGAR|nr:hypothetical protein BXZ70DRAFT_1011480 [Cristinia sonorae]
MGRTIWALLVSIEKYADPSWPHVKGASRDTERLRAYFEALSSSSSSTTSSSTTTTTTTTTTAPTIMTLTESRATRAGIIDAFRTHLIENERIRTGDALVFAFSGHGSRSPAPDGWAVVVDTSQSPSVSGSESEEESEEEIAAMLEMIIPYDEGTPDPKTGLPVCGIPDRTLGALLDRAEARHGDNITVILDCCHSGHGTRAGNSSTDDEENPFQVRGLDPGLVTPLRPGVDSILWQYDEKKKKKTRGGSHVLLAACGPHEQALGDKHGGLLTTYLLSALQDGSVRPRTYVEVMKHVNRSVDALRARWPRYVTQHGQCEGVRRERVVWEDTVVDPRLFKVTGVGKGTCRVWAGEVQGVRVGTAFEVYVLDGEMKRAGTVGRAVAREVFGTYCVATGVEVGKGEHRASVLEAAYGLRFCVAGTASGLMASVEAKLGEDVSAVLQRVEEEEEADLVLAVDGEGVTFIRRDVMLRDLASRPPRLTADELEDADLPAILLGIARFNFYLAHSSHTRPYAGDVALELHVLEPDADHDELDGSPLTRARKLARRVPFHDGEAVVAESEDEYAFVVRNHGAVALFPHIVYFDPGTYEIQAWYGPFEAEKPTLLPRSSLQVGASPEHRTPFSFYLREGEMVDSSFIRLFLLDAEAQMGFIEQRPLMGWDGEGARVVLGRKRGSAAEPGTEVAAGWDAITVKITCVYK